MKYAIKVLTTITMIALLFSCQSNSFTENKTVEEAVKDYYKTIFNWTSGPNSDIKVFLNSNRQEILSTLECSEVVEAKDKNLALAFVRFSIGTTIVRQGLWFHRLEDNWTKTGINSLNYSYEYAGYKEKDEELKDLLERKEKWEDENPEIWWVRYIED